MNARTVYKTLLLLQIQNNLSVGINFLRYVDFIRDYEV